MGILQASGSQPPTDAKGHSETGASHNAENVHDDAVVLNSSVATSASSEPIAQNVGELGSLQTHVEKKLEADAEKHAGDEKHGCEAPILSPYIDIHPIHQLRTQESYSAVTLRLFRKGVAKTSSQTPTT